MLKRALLLLLAIVFPLASSAQPSIVLVNGRVFTADPGKPWAEAVAIAGKKISAVGTNAEVRALATEKTRVIDAGGRVVIPGINDAHTHPAFVTPSFSLVQELDPSWPQLESAIVNAIEETPASLWINVTVGPAIINNVNISAEDLDEIAPGRLVRLHAFTGHGVILSSAAMKALGVDRDAKDPAGGWYGRDSDGRVDGRLWEYAQFEADRKFAELASDEDILDDLQQTAASALRWGITSMQAMPGVSAERFAKLLARSRTPLRVRRIRFMNDAATPAKGEPVKWILDGTPIEQNAALRSEKYDGGARGLGRENFADITPLVKSAAEHNQPLLVHASGDRTIESALKAFAKFPALQRPRIEHGDGLQSDLEALAKQTGAVVVLNPTHFPFRGAYPAGQYMRAKSLLKAGIPIAIGSDGPMNPFLNILHVIQRDDHGNRGEELTREEAVIAYTRGGAYAEFAEKEKGTIAPGMLADLAVLSQDIFTVRGSALPDTTSVLTIIDGKIVHSELQ
ncbi:MAG TPA: amidohydrolase family protein [Thermoanaerobaculia bacterium]|nr:amidohydrolase family protein [Thermoanaerobaculia bacterium]